MLPELHTIVCATDPGPRMRAAFRRTHLFRCSSFRATDMPLTARIATSSPAMRGNDKPRLAMRQLRCHGFGPADLAVETGECVGLSGPSGAGKTLLLRAIADLDEHEGEVSLDGVSARSFDGPSWRRQVGLLAAESAWWAETVREHLRESNAEWLRTLGFTSSVLDWRVHRLSSGERQRLALVRLLCNEPRVLLLDEPTANLDPENGQRVESLMAHYRSERGAAVLWVSHDPGQLRRVTDRAYRIENGGLREGGLAA
jgi:putative ABC transport system ATP-binding protein